MAIRFPRTKNNPRLLHTALEKLYRDDRIKAVLDQHVPNVRDLPNYPQMKQLTLGLMRMFAPQIMSVDKLQSIASELDALERPAHASC